MMSWETAIKRMVRLRLESQGVRVRPRSRRPLDPYGLSDRDDDPLLSLAPSTWPLEPEHKAHAASLHYASEGCQARDVLAAFKPRDGRRRCIHPLCELLLRHLQFHPKLDDDTGNCLRHRKFGMELAVLLGSERLTAVIVESASDGARATHIHDRHPSACLAQAFSKPPAVAVLVLGGRPMNAQESCHG